KVALVGQGPDELFGGYKRHIGVRYGSAWRALPEWARSPVAAALRRIPRADTLKRGLASLGERDRLTRYQAVLALMERRRIDALFRDDVLRSDPAKAMLDCWADLAP